MLPGRRKKNKDIFRVRETDSLESQMVNLKTHKELHQWFINNEYLVFEYRLELRKEVTYSGCNKAVGGLICCECLSPTAMHSLKMSNTKKSPKRIYWLKPVPQNQLVSYTACPARLMRPSITCPFNYLAFVPAICHCVRMLAFQNGSFWLKEI